MLRNFGAIVAGLLVGGLANAVITALNTFVLFPPPPGIDFEDPEQLTAYVASLPLAAFLVTMLAHLVQAGLGGWVAARLSSSRPVLLALIVGFLTLLGTVANLVQMGGPLWFVGELPLDLGVAWWAGERVRRRRG